MRSSPAALRNRAPILNVLKEVIQSYQVSTVFEVGSGTGEHATYFADHLKLTSWTVSDVEANHDQLSAIARRHPVLHGPIRYEIEVDPLPTDPIDMIYTANTLHIVSWAQVKRLIRDVGQKLQTGGIFFIYGPFNENGSFTSESNETFDQHLRERDPLSGIREREFIEELMNENGLKSHVILDMPANNKVLIYKKT